MQIVNKKGFTLVELLAVIVILALIMSIAIVSLSGIMQSARESTFKETALQIIDGVKQQLMLANELKPSDKAFGDNTDANKNKYVSYYFESKIIESGGKTSPLGGNIQYIGGSGNARKNSTATDKALYPYTFKLRTNKSTATAVRPIGTKGVYRSKTNYACAKTTYSYVAVHYNGKNFEYSICLTASDNGRYIDSTGFKSVESNLLDTNNTSMIIS